MPNFSTIKSQSKQMKVSTICFPHVLPHSSADILDLRKLAGISADFSVKGSGQLANIGTPRHQMVTRRFAPRRFPPSRFASNFHPSRFAPHTLDVSPPIPFPPSRFAPNLFIYYLFIYLFETAKGQGIDR